MKYLTLVLATFAAVVTGTLGNEDIWVNFKLSHDKEYESAHEAAHRQRVFSDNLRTIEEHNARYAAGEVSWRMAVNRFADMTPEEFAAFQNASVLPGGSVGLQRSFFKPTGLREHPSQVDYRPLFGPIRDQVACGSCYALTVSSVLEANYMRKHGRRVQLSPQNLVDCSNVKPYNNQGCVGGYLSNSVDYVRDHGLMLEADYPYRDRLGECHYNRSRVGPVKVTGFVPVHNTDLKLEAALSEHGPLAVAVDAKDWQFYDGGVFHPTRPFKQLTHAVALVGYGVTDGTGKRFWRLRNSYGPNWGEDGYMRVDRSLKPPYHIGLGFAETDSIAPVFPIVE